MRRLPPSRRSIAPGRPDRARQKVTGAHLLQPVYCARDQCAEQRRRQDPNQTGSTTDDTDSCHHLRRGPPGIERRRGRRAGREIRAAGAASGGLARRPRARGGPGPGARGAEHARLVLLRHLPRRRGEDRRAVARKFRRQHDRSASRHRRADDPQAARRHDAAAPGRTERPDAGDDRARSPPRSRPDRRRGRAPPESGLAAVPAAEPRRVRARGPAICSASTSTSPPSCRPTRSAPASTTSPTCRPSRRR